MVLQASFDLLSPSFIIFLVIFVILGSGVLFVTALVTFLNTENMDDDRVVWAIIIVFAGAIGSILWLIIGRPKFKKLSRLP